MASRYHRLRLADPPVEGGMPCPDYSWGQDDEEADDDPADGDDWRSPGGDK